MFTIAQTPSTTLQPHDDLGYLIFNMEQLTDWFIDSEEVGRLAQVVPDVLLLSVRVDNTLIILPTEIPDLLYKAIKDDKEVIWVGPKAIGTWEAKSAQRAVLRTLTKAVYKAIGKHYASLIK